MGSNTGSIKLKNILAFIVDNRGKTPPLCDNGYRLLEVNAVSASTKYPLYNNVRKHVDSQTYSAWFRKGHPQIGDILIPTVGTLGAVSFINTNNCCIAQNLIAIRPDQSICDSHYLYYYLSNPMIQKRLLNLDIGGVQPSIKVPHLLDLDINLPSLEQQRKCAAILRVLDDKIELNQQINDNLYAHARALTAQWLANNDGRYELLPLSEIALINPDSYSSKDRWEYVNYLDTSSIVEGVITEIQCIFPAKEKLPSRARRIITANDVVFSTVRPNQRHFGLINNPLPHMLASTGFAVIRSNHPDVCNELIYLCLTENMFIEKMQQLAEQSTSTFPSIKPSDLGNCEIPCPIKENCMNPSTHLKVLFLLISANQSENKSLASLRESLLPKLISGEIDVSDIQF